MRRALAALGILALVCTAGVAVPAGSGAASAKMASAKSKCKHRHPHKRKRCRRKAAGSPAATGGGSSDAGGGPSGPPGRLLATEREVSADQLQLQLSRPALPAGSTIVEHYNAGSDPHNLVAERAGNVAFSFGSLDPGGDQRQTVTLHHGTYTLYCSLLNHRSLGMQATLTVN
jgi:plastocyanin